MLPKRGRFKTRVVPVGKVLVGGDHPVRIQSMTTSDTRDVEKTVEQIIMLADYGCEIARVTVQGMKEADACEGIKNSLLKKGYDIPLVADIHFYPPAAMRVVDFVDKVRVNPGNFVDKRAIFKQIDYEGDAYEKEIEKIEEKFAPLVEKCKKLKRAMRIGTNHGSLSDRIMSRYGDTAYGMVESAFEFTRVCRKYDYHDIIFSMKASNPIVMIEAYRLLVEKMIELGWDYPVHLGVTEAGDGEDGRVKSAIGTGSLLLDGIGDTIRVSLTEDPWFEIDPCKRLIALAESYQETQKEPYHDKKKEQRRKNVSIPEGYALHKDGTVIQHISTEELKRPDALELLGFDMQFGRPKSKESSPDALFVEGNFQGCEKILNDLASIGVKAYSFSKAQGVIPILKPNEVIEKRPFALFVDAVNNLQGETFEEAELIFLKLEIDKLHQGRKFFHGLKRNIPVILFAEYLLEREDLVIHAAAELGSLFSDGYGEGICLAAPKMSQLETRNLSFNILQGCRMRHSKTEFIACPGCGRTLFNLQQVTQRIRSKTSHLPGVKIAIMGCIVNGPGEMADADFGYVGSRSGKVDLYVGKTCVEKNIDFEAADERLIALIKEQGKWKDPESASVPALTLR